ncbi:hypothetical protein EJ110_NYTH17037 [Nymphaea thermarum]|nr:hypothetical protein EJ110_NYTH17037 [Nymphaea thermarum]
MAYTAILFGGCSRPAPSIPPANALRLPHGSATSSSFSFLRDLDRRHRVPLALGFTRRILRVGSYQHDDAAGKDANAKASIPGSVPSMGGDRSSSSRVGDEKAEWPEGKNNWKVKNEAQDSVIAKLAIVCGLAVIVAIALACFKRFLWGPSSSGLQFSLDGSVTSTPEVTSDGFNLKVFGCRLTIPEYTPGWVYFCLLMAAGCGLFISEEALNIWVGMSLARRLVLDGSWESFAASFSNSASNIVSTVLWVYWGVCISDLIPFYLGQLVSRTKAPDEVFSKLGVSKKKANHITRVVKRYGNLIGFVERFSLGVRNPTAFLAGAMVRALTTDYGQKTVWAIMAHAHNRGFSGSAAGCPVAH